MTFEGKVLGGVVQLPGGVALPDGTLVTVVVERQSTGAERMSDKEHARLMAIARRIALLPDENPGDNFSGADHDKALYGES